MIASQLKFCQFFLQGKMTQITLHGEFITESQAVIKQPETDIQKSAGFFLFQCHPQLFMVVSDLTVLSPDCFPNRIATIYLCFYYAEITVKCNRRTYLKAHFAFFYHFFFFVYQRIDWFAFV